MYRINVSNPFATALKEHIPSYDVQELILSFANIGFCPIHCAVIPRVHHQTEFKCLFCDLTYCEFPLHEPMEWTKSASDKQIVSFGWQDKELQHHIAEVIKKWRLQIQYSSGFKQDSVLIENNHYTLNWTITFRNDKCEGVIRNGILSDCFFH